MAATSSSRNSFLNLIPKTTLNVNKFPINMSSNVTVRRVTPRQAQDESIFNGRYFLNKYGSRKKDIQHSKSAEPLTKQKSTLEHHANADAGKSVRKLSGRKTTRIPIKISNSENVLSKTFIVPKGVLRRTPNVVDNSPDLRKLVDEKENKLRRATEEKEFIQRTLEFERKKCREIAEKNKILDEENAELKRILHDKKLSERKMQVKCDALLKSCEVVNKKYLSAQMNNDQLSYRLRCMSSNSNGFMYSGNRTLGATPSSTAAEYYRTGPSICVIDVDDISKSLKFDHHELETPNKSSTKRKFNHTDDEAAPRAKR